MVYSRGCSKLSVVITGQYWYLESLKVIVQAHKLITLAEAESGKSAEAKNALFRATYEEGANVSDEDVLRQVCARIFL